MAVHLFWIIKIRETFSDKGDDGRHEVFRNMCRFIRGVDAEINCTLEMTRPYVLAMNGAFESCGRPRRIPPEYVTRLTEAGAAKTWIHDIGRIIERAASERKLFSELGIPWATPTQWFDVRGYTRFDLQF